MQKVWITIIAILLFTFGLSISVSAQPGIEGNAYILIDGETGQVLYGKDIDNKLHPASTTKILTTIIALEKGNLQGYGNDQQECSFS